MRPAGRPSRCQAAQRRPRRCSRRLARASPPRPRARPWPAPPAHRRRPSRAPRSVASGRPPSARRGVLSGRPASGRARPRSGSSGAASDGLIGGCAHGLAGAIRGRPVLAEDRFDQLGLAQAAKAVQPDLVGDRVQVGQSACLKLGALEYGHWFLLLRWWDRAVGVPPRWTAAGTRVDDHPSGRLGRSRGSPRSACR